MKKYFLFPVPGLLIIFIITVLLFSSCSKTETPDNSHQLTLVSQEDAPVTRATIDNKWNGGEQVQVSIDNGAAVTFTANPDGRLIPVAPRYWPPAPQSITARAWYPGTWTFPADQRGGLQAADFIFASTVTGITASNYTTKPLVFQHRTAKVTVNLVAGTDVGNLNGAAVAFYGFTTGIPNTTHAGDGVITGSGNDWITPQNTGVNRYTALLIPRDMTGTKFVRITLGGNDYFYTPAAGRAVLQQGMAYTYNSTVHRTRLEVEVVNGIVWTDGDEYDITPQ
jgi:hypothetical protein